MFVIVLLCLLLSVFNVHAAPIEVNIDRSTVSLNESFQVEFFTTEDPDGNPDFEPLETEFEVLDRNHGSEMSWINGVSSNKIKWTFTLMAKQAGEQIIPSLSFGSETSPEKTITVTELPQEELNIDAPMFLQVDVDNEKPYLHQQVVYKLRFFRRDYIQIAEASLDNLTINDAIIEKLGETKEYKTEVKGVAYVVNEINYAIFPQKSGEIHLPPMKITIAVMANPQRRYNSLFGSFATRRERIVSQAITLDVQPIPAQIKTENWLVSEQVYLEQQWSTETEKATVGEPLTRTLRLFAKGVMGSQLPQLHQQDSSNQTLKAYPDKAKVQEQKNASGMVGFREEKVALIPSKAGTFTLPELKIAWFNLRTGQQEFARLPETVIKVAPSMTDNVTQQMPTQPQPVQEETKVKPQAVETLIETNPLWQWLSFGFALAWLITLVFLFKKKASPKKASETDSEPAEIKQKAFLKQLKKACGNNDAEATKALLISWGQQNYNVASLGGLAKYSQARLRNELLTLEQVLYSAENNTWQGKNLYQCFYEQQAFAKVTQKQPEVLEPLYRL